MRTISLDASTTHIGWSVWDDDDLVDYGLLTPTNKKLDWRERIQDFVPQIMALNAKFKPNKAIQEDVPKVVHRGKGNGIGAIKTAIMLGAVQGMSISVFTACNIPIEFKEVGTWRSDIGILKGAKDRESQKVYSIEMANKLFNVGLVAEYTKGGNFKETGADDQSDSILLYASTRDKYKVKNKRRKGDN